MIAPRDVATRGQDLWQAYRRRWTRRRLLARGIHKRRELAALIDRTDGIGPGAILAFATLRNEAERLPHFLRHYRALGVSHFLLVDNASTDGSAELLRAAPDVSLWTTGAGYKAARFGVDWLAWLRLRHGHGRWCLTIDADEILVYPFWQTRPLGALTEQLALMGERSFGALMLDLYPRGPLGDHPCGADEDPLETLRWFDAGNYTIHHQVWLDRLAIQGGVRARSFFADDPRRAPSLAKVPLVYWDRRFAYVDSTHSLLPRRLNRTYATDGGEKLSGVLLHTKFLSNIAAKSREEKRRRQHFSNSELYDRYYDDLAAGPDLWCPGSTRYRGWRHLEALGLMSRGTWL